MRSDEMNYLLNYFRWHFRLILKNRKILLDTLYFFVFFMLPKKQRLNGKDIAYILRKGQKVYGKFLIFRFIPQYKNLRYRQASIQIPVKLDKRATRRNMLKRHALIQFEHMMKEKNQYFKIFIFVNKQSLQPLKEALESKEKTHILSLREAQCKKDFSLFFQKLWKHSWPNFRRWSIRQRNWWNNWKRKNLKPQKN